MNEMMMKFEYDDTVVIPSGSQHAIAFIGDHPAMGHAENGGTSIPSQKWLTWDERFRWFKPLGVQMKWQPHLDTSRTVITKVDQTTGNTTLATLRLTDVDYAYDPGNTLATMNTSYNSDAASFKGWVQTKPQSMSLNPYKPFRVFRKTAARDRVTAADSLILRRGGFLDTTKVPGVGYHIFSYASETTTTANRVIGVMHLTWYGVFLDAGDPTPPTP